MFRDGALHAQIVADFVLEVADDRAQSDAFRRSAELRDAYLREFYDMADRVARGYEAIDLDRLKARLEAITANVLGQDAVRAVLLHNVVISEV